MSESLEEVDGLRVGCLISGREDESESERSDEIGIIRLGTGWLEFVEGGESMM